MKTNVTMVSQGSRELYGVVIRQNTKDSFLSLTDLQEAYTHARVINGWSDKVKVQEILSYKTNVQRIYYILREIGYLDGVSESEFSSDVDNIGMVKYLKKIGLYKTTGRAENKTTWCNMSIWLLAAVELSPDFYSKVIEFISDGKNFREYHCGYEDFKSEERINRENAWRHFYPEGNGKPKKGYVLHHKDPTWRYEDFERYAKWSVTDLVMMKNGDHIRLHKKLGYEYIDIDRDFQLIEACDLNYNLRIALNEHIASPDYAGINRALNIKVFGHHETGMRNLASEEELKRLNTLQENIAFCIQRGYLNDNSSVIKEIQR